MGASNADRLVTDALLLDAVEGLDAMASSLTLVYADLRHHTCPLASTAIVLELLEHVGWWSGRLDGAVSTATRDALSRLRPSDEA